MAFKRCSRGDWTFSGFEKRFRVMEVSENITCPYCGQKFDLVIDTSVPTQRFTTDCEVCCRPFQVVAECEPGEVLSLEIQAD
jgi:hypothetical protein